MRKSVVISCIIAAILGTAAIGAVIGVIVKKNQDKTELGNDRNTTITITTSNNVVKRINGNESNSTFALRNIYSTGLDSKPYHLSVGDINNDKKPDIVFANQLQHTIDILINDGHGRFTFKSSFSTGLDSHPQHVSLADVNNDEHLDMIVANHIGCNFGVLLNNGNGSFHPQVSYSTGEKSYPTSLAVADMNNDNRPDVVITHQNNDIITIFLNIGQGLFQFHRKYSLESGTGAHFPSIVDMNDDSYPDIVVSNHRSSEIAIHYNAGDGTLISQRKYSTGNNTQCQEHRLVDINNDKKRDLIVANSHTNNLGIFINIGDGTFSPQKTISTGISSGPHALAVVDVTNDRYPDIIVTNLVANNIHIYANSGHGNFIIHEIYSLGKGALPNSLVMHDVNNDKKLDMIVVDIANNKIYVYLAR